MKSLVVMGLILGIFTLLSAYIINREEVHSYTGNNSKDLIKKTVEVDSLIGKAENGDVSAYAELEDFYLSNNNWSEKSQKALSCMRRLSEEGISLAQYYLGRMYEYGYTEFDDPMAEAVKMYRISAENGCLEAQKWMGERSYRDNGIWLNDTSEAFKWYHMAALQGDCESQILVGKMYYEGNGPRKDFYQAARWYKQAAEQGDNYANFLLGAMHYYGEGVVLDEKLAKHYYQKFVEPSNNSKPFPRWNFREAVYAASCGSPQAQYVLGELYWNGDINSFDYSLISEDTLSVAKDYKQGLKFMELAAKAGQINAQFKLGLIYYSGDQVTKNYTEAAKWFKLAADSGYKDACMNLGYMYYLGQGMKQDYSEAYYYFFAAGYGYDYGYGGRFITNPDSEKNVFIIDLASRLSSDQLKGLENRLEKRSADKRKKWVIPVDNKQ